MDVEKAKSDIVYFAEEFLGIHLLEWQKDLLEKYQQGEIIFYGGHRGGKNTVLNVIEQHRKLKE